MKQKKKFDLKTYEKYKVGDGIKNLPRFVFWFFIVGPLNVLMRYFNRETLRHFLIVEWVPDEWPPILYPFRWAFCLIFYIFYIPLFAIAFLVSPYEKGGTEEK